MYIPESTAHVMSVLDREHVSSCSVCNETEDMIRQPLTATIEYRGDFNGTFLLNLSYGFAEDLTAFLVGPRQAFSLQELGDTCGEVANMILGDMISRCDPERPAAEPGFPVFYTGSVEHVFPRESISGYAFLRKQGRGAGSEDDRFYVGLILQGPGPRKRETQ